VSYTGSASLRFIAVRNLGSGLLSVFQTKRKEK
jgi:hypothetical protein